MCPDIPEVVREEEGFVWRSVWHLSSCFSWPIDFCSHERIMFRVNTRRGKAILEGVGIQSDDVNNIKDTQLTLVEP